MNSLMPAPLTQNEKAGGGEEWSKWNAKFNSAMQELNWRGLLKI
jgi:hypothetical protein